MWRCADPGWIGWALGKEHTDHLTLHAPVAHVTAHWMTVPSGSYVRVGFQSPVISVAYGEAGHLARHTLDSPQKTISLGKQSATGAVEIAAAPRSWERLGRPTQVSWFPPSRYPVMVTLPAAGSSIAPASKTLPDLLQAGTRSAGLLQGHGCHRARPDIGREPNSHTLVFTPSGYGMALGSHLRVQLPRTVSASLSSSGSSEYHQPGRMGRTPGPTLRLHQLLAQAGYLPVLWQSVWDQPVDTHPEQPRRRLPSNRLNGSFSWRFSNTPHQLVAMWNPNEFSTITKAALMKFESPSMT